MQEGWPIRRLSRGSSNLARNTLRRALRQPYTRPRTRRTSTVLTPVLAPSHPLEAALLITLAPGAYTAHVSGVAGTTGVGLVAVFEVATQ